MNKCEHSGVALDEKPEQTGATASWIDVSIEPDFKASWQMAAGALIALGKEDVVKKIGEICAPYRIQYTPQFPNDGGGE